MACVRARACAVQVSKLFVESFVSVSVRSLSTNFTSTKRGHGTYSPTMTSTQNGSGSGTVAGFATVRDHSGGAAAADKIDYGPVMQKLRRHFNSGKTRSLSYRRKQLQGLRSMLTEHIDEFIDALRGDLRRHPQMCLFGDIFGSITAIDDALDKMDSWAAPREQGGQLEMPFAKTRLVPQPKGVLLLITAWNFPVDFVFNGLSQMLAAGNCVIVKPSEVRTTPRDHHACTSCCLFPIRGHPCFWHSKCPLLIACLFSKLRWCHNCCKLARSRSMSKGCSSSSSRSIWTVNVLLSLRVLFQKPPHCCESDLTIYVSLAMVLLDALCTKQPQSTSLQSRWNLAARGPVL